MRLLHRLCRCETITKMGASQFGVCFGPTLLRAQQPQQEVMDVASGINAKVSYFQTQWRHCLIVVAILV